MRRMNILALTLALAVALAAIVDSVVRLVAGRRTFLTDDTLATPVQAAAVSALLVAAYLSQALVVWQQRDTFALGNRVTRLTRWPVLIGLLMLGVGGLVHSLLPADPPAAVTAASDAAVGLALLLTFGSAVALGLSTVSRNPLGIGARLLSALLPTAALTVLLGFLADDLASPIFVSVITGLGLSLLGVPVPGRSREGRRPQPAVLR